MNTKPTNNSQPIVHRSITLKVDLRAVAAFGGALIILGALLPWVTPLYAQLDRLVNTGSLIGGWPLVVIGLFAIIALFLPKFRMPRVSLSAAAFGFVAGLLALSSAINTIGLRQIAIGDQTISAMSGIGLGVFLTLAGSIIAIIAGLAPLPIGSNEPARAEIKLWQSSSAVIASLFVVLALAGMVLGLWLGGGGLLGTGTPTPQSFNANVIGTPLINIQVNPLATFTPNPISGSTETPTASPITPVEPISPSVQPTETPNNPEPADTPTPTTESPTETPTDTATPTGTATPTATVSTSSLETPTQ